MFAPNPALERQQQQSRGYVLGLILLIMFLSSQDLSPPSRRRMEAAQEMREGINKHREDIKEKVSGGANATSWMGGGRARDGAPALSTPQNEEQPTSENKPYV